MKQILHKIVACSMALVVLFSTMSFSMAMHYCGDTLVDTAIVKELKTCGMDMEQPTSQSCSVDKKDCCTNSQLSVEGQDELQLNIDKLSLEQQIFVAAFVYTYTAQFNELHNKVIPFKDYTPPLVVKDIQLLDEVYLI